MSCMLCHPWLADPALCPYVQKVDCLQAIVTHQLSLYLTMFPAVHLFCRRRHPESPQAACWVTAGGTRLTQTTALHAHPAHSACMWQGWHV
jgi:hypothetical protein